MILITFLTGVKFQEKIPEKYRDSISYLVEKNILKGFPDGSYKVDWAITEAEFLTLLVRCNVKQEREVERKNLIEIIKKFIVNIYNYIKKNKSNRFNDYEEYWFHPYLVEYSLITKLNENLVDPFFYISVYEALFFIIYTTPFKDEINEVTFPLDSKSKAMIVITAVSHRLFPNGISFKEKLSRGEAFLLIEKYLRSKENDFNY